MPDNLINITIPSDIGWLNFVEHSLRRYSLMVGFSPKLENMLASSIMEACEELHRAAEKAGVSDRVDLRFNFKGEAVIVEIEYNGRIPLSPHQADEYEVPDSGTELNDIDLNSLWLHIIKQRLDRIHFMVKGSRRILRMVKYRRDEGGEKQAWIMSVTPELRKRLILHLDDQEAEHPSSVLQNPGGGVLKLGPGETFIIRRMDGRTSFHDLYMAHIDALGIISPDALVKLFEKLEIMQMLSDPDGDGKKNRFFKLIKKIINPNFNIPRADEIITAIHDRIKFLFNPVWAVLMLATGLSGVIPAALNWDLFKATIAGLEETLLTRPWVILPVYILTLVHIMMHELARGTTCKHYGGKVPRLGVMFYLASFIFYCDAAAAWTFPKLRQRILVSLSGPLVSLTITGICLWAISFLAGTDSIWLTIVICLSLINIMGLTINFNPFIKMDAYYMLIDITGIPNLRSNSFNFIQQRVLSRLGIDQEKETLHTPREQRIFWWYGILGCIATVLFTAMPISRLNRLLNSESLYGGELLWTVLAIVLLLVRLSKAAFKTFKSARYRDYKIQ